MSNNMVGSVILIFTMCILLACSIFLLVGAILQSNYQNRVLTEISNKIILHNNKNDHNKVVKIAERIDINFWPDYHLLERNYVLNYEAKLALADSLYQIGEYDMANNHYRMILDINEEQYDTLQLLINNNHNLRELAIKQ